MAEKGFSLLEVDSIPFNGTEKVIQITVSMMSRCYVAALYAILLFWRRRYEGSAPQDKIFDMLFLSYTFFERASIRVPKTKGIDCTNAQQPYDNIHDSDKHFFETQYLAISEVFPGYHDQNILL